MPKRINPNDLRGLVSKDNKYVLTLDDCHTCYVMPSHVNLPPVATISLTSTDWPDLLKALNFEAPCYVELTRHDREKLQALHRLGVRKLYAYEQEENCVRIYPPYPLKGDCWYMRDYLSQELIDYTNTHKKVVIAELLD